MDKNLLISKIIGEGSTNSWIEAVGSIEKYNQLQASDNDSISDVIAKNLSELLDEDFIRFMLKHLSHEDTLTDWLICSDCDTLIHWEGSHHRNGIVYECESCGKPICSKCIEDHFGSSISSLEDIICPNCTKEKTPKKEIFFEDNFSFVELSDDTFKQLESLNIGPFFTTDEQSKEIKQILDVDKSDEDEYLRAIRNTVVRHYSAQHKVFPSPYDFNTMMSVTHILDTLMSNPDN